MASYSYKDVCNQIPPHIEARFEFLYGREPDGDPNYNGDYWTLTAMWIEELLDDLEPNPETVTIPVHTMRDLICGAEELAALGAAGVDNWHGCDEVDTDEMDRIRNLSNENFKKEFGGK